MRVYAYKTLKRKHYNDVKDLAPKKLIYLFTVAFEDVAEADDLRLAMIAATKENAKLLAFQQQALNNIDAGDDAEEPEAVV